MYETNCPATLSTPAGDVLFNVDLGDGSMYFFDKVSGLDGIPRRAPAEDAPVTDGLLWHDWKKSGRRPLYEGTILVANDTAWNQVAQRNQMGQFLEDCLESIANLVTETGTYSWTPTGMGLMSLTVRNDIEINYTGKIIKSFVFGLLAADPVIQLG